MSELPKGHDSGGHNLQTLFQIPLDTIGNYVLQMAESPPFSRGSDSKVDCVTYLYLCTDLLCKECGCKLSSLTLFQNEFRAGYFPATFFDAAWLHTFLGSPQAIGSCGQNENNVLCN